MKFWMVIVLSFSLYSEVLADETEGCRIGAPASNILVTNNSDTGPGSLREVLSQGVCGGLNVSFESDMTITLESPLALGNLFTFVDAKEKKL